MCLSGLLPRLELGVHVPRDQQREIVRLLYVSTRHQVMIAAVADPRVGQLAIGRADAAAVYDAAAAERSRNDRRAIASRLRHGGVEVIDAPPTELAPELANRYLAMKATGRL